MKLDKERILGLLAEADTKWFNNHNGKYSYREHLDFTADYIAKHYEKKSANQNREKGNGATGTETTNLHASF